MSNARHSIGRYKHHMMSAVVIESQPSESTKSTAKPSKYRRRDHIPPSQPFATCKMTMPSNAVNIQPASNRTQTTSNSTSSFTRQSEHNVIGFDEREYTVVNHAVIPDILDKERTREVYDKYAGVCWWCMHPWNGKFVGCPFRVTGNEIRMEGFFCSWNCAMAYGDTHNDSTAVGNLSTRRTLIRILSKAAVPDLTSIQHVVLKPAPNFRCLDIFGGPLTIEQFRQQHCSNIRIDCFNERWNIAPYGIICYFKDLSAPLRRFDDEKSMPKKLIVKKFEDACAQKERSDGTTRIESTKKRKAREVTEMEGKIKRSKGKDPLLAKQRKAQTKKKFQDIDAFID